MKSLIEMKHLTLGPVQVSGFMKFIFTLFPFLHGKTQTPTLSIPDEIKLGPGIHPLIGLSGSGKSVFLSMLAGYPGVGGCLSAKGEHAHFTVNRQEIRLPSNNLRTDLQKIYRKTPCIYLPQLLPIIPRDTTKADEYIRLVLSAYCRLCDPAFQKLKHPDKLKKAIRDLTSITDAALLDCYAGRLSGGERRRIEVLTRFIVMNHLKKPEASSPSDQAIGDASDTPQPRRTKPSFKALVNQLKKRKRPQPAILLLDEPTTGLDPCRAEALCDLVRKCNKETQATVLIATHNPEQIKKATSLLIAEKQTKKQADGNLMTTITIRQYTDASDFLKKHARESANPANSDWSQVYEILNQRSENEKTDQIS